MTKLLIALAPIPMERIMIRNPGAISVTKVREYKNGKSLRSKQKLFFKYFALYSLRVAHKWARTFNITLYIVAIPKR